MESHEDHMNNRVVACLKRAKGLLVRYGWIQGRFGDKEHGFCAIRKAEVLAAFDRAIKKAQRS